MQGVTKENVPFNLLSVESTKPMEVGIDVKGRAVIGAGQYKTVCMGPELAGVATVIAHIGASDQKQFPIAHRAASLLREVSIYEALQEHRPLPNVIEYFGRCQVFDQSGEECDGFLLPFVKGGTLQTAIRRKTLTSADIKRVMVDVSTAIGGLHRVGFAFLDLKADNVLLKYTPDGRVEQALIADFGIAQSFKTMGDVGIRCVNCDIASPDLKQAWAKMRVERDFQKRAQVIGAKRLMGSDVYSIGNLLDELIDWDDNSYFFWDHLLDEDETQRFTAEQAVDAFMALDDGALKPKGSIQLTPELVGYVTSFDQI